MDYKNPSIAQLTELINTMQTPDQLAYIQKMVSHRLHTPDLRNALFGRLASLLQSQTAAPFVATTANIQQDGTVYDLNQWLTFSEYANRYGLKSTNIVNNWISRGIVPPNCIVELRHLNSLKLIRNQNYKAML